MTTMTHTCHKCDGSGHIRAFSHILGGVCFTCAGSGRVEVRRPAANRYSPINAMHCETLAEAQAFRMAEFGRRFPELVGKMDDRSRNLIANGCGNLRSIVEGIATS
jgi:hypothetical protein